MKVKTYPLLSIHELGKRENQEDVIFPALGKCADEEHIFVLCDGMGGHEHGEVASQTVCAAISKHLQEHWPEDGRVEDQLVLNAIEAAFDALDSIADGTTKGMGTTLTLVVLHDGGCTAAHIGDSRIYHIRPKERQLLYRSRDHSLVFELYQAGEISYDQMRTSPQRNIITKAMQPGEDNRVRPDITHIGDLRPGDYLYMCSDGMMEQIDDKRVVDIFASDRSDEEKRNILVEETWDNNDNHSAHLIHIKAVTREDGETITDDERDTRCNALNVVPPIETIEVDAKADGDVRVIAANEPKMQKKYRPSGIRWIWVIVAAVVIVAVAAILILCHGESET